MKQIKTAQEVHEMNSMRRFYYVQSLTRDEGVQLCADDIIRRYRAGELSQDRAVDILQKHATPAYTPEQQQMFINASNSIR